MRTSQQARHSAKMMPRDGDRDIGVSRQGAMADNVIVEISDLFQREREAIAHLGRQGVGIHDGRPSRSKRLSQSESSLNGFEPIIPSARTPGRSASRFASEVLFCCDCRVHIRVLVLRTRDKTEARMWICAPNS
jgi:hypothetical protein